MALGKMESEVLTMTFPQVYRLFRYWRTNPPVHELLAIGIRVFTTWQPAEEKPDPPDVAHRKSLEKRWAAGYMNIKQMFEGGASGFVAAAPGSAPSIPN